MLTARAVTGQDGRRCLHGLDTGRLSTHSLADLTKSMPVQKDFTPESKTTLGALGEKHSLLLHHIMKNTGYTLHQHCWAGTSGTTKYIKVENRIFVERGKLIAEAKEKTIS